MSDAPMKSLETVLSVNNTDLPTENSTLMSPAAESFPQGKMVSPPVLAHLNSTNYSYA